MKSLFIKIAFIALISIAAGILFAGCSYGENEEAEENIPTHSDYIVRYVAETGGYIDGEDLQVVNDGESGKAVTAVPNEGYEFYKWSDGVTTAVRRESDVKSDITVTAKFNMKLYKLYYRVEDEAIGGGKVNGETYQLRRYGETGSAVTAVPNAGYEFSGWSDGVTTAKRRDENIGNDINVYAVFTKKRYKVIYRTSYDFYGLLHVEDGESDTQRIELSISRGESVTVTAMPGENIKGERYVFIEWSDGVTTAERTDVITDNLNVTAYFGYEIDYSVNNSVGGRIEGKTEQKLYPDEVGETVTAVPNDGYVFCGWSDLSFEPTRPGDYLFLTGINSSAYTVCEYMAYFEPITKTFAYNYGGGVMPTETEITLNRNDIKSAEFVVPKRDEYVFCGWYADDDYSIRITDETGRYMYGYAAFSLESDTLYARWRDADEEYDPHKILLIFTDEICADIKSYKDKNIYSVHTKMAGGDYQVCKWITQRVKAELTECLSDKVKIEVDAYYTIDVVSNPVAGEFAYGDIFANQIIETALFANKYHNTITYFDYGEHRDLYHASGTTDSSKNSCVYRGFSLWNDSRKKIMPRIIRQLTAGAYDFMTLIDTSLHEFAHAAENGCEDIYEFHEALIYVYHEDSTVAKNSIPTIRKYLRGELMIDGEACGVSSEYWEHATLVTINYVPLPAEQRNAGKIRVVDGNRGYESHNCVSGEIQYGSSITVEAVPLDGYRFVMWSDGVTTAVRHDSDIIARLDAKAIFEKNNLKGENNKWKNSRKASLLFC